MTPMFRALSVRNYRLYFTGQVLSNTGTWMQRVAQDWLVLDLSGTSGVALGITTGTGVEVGNARSTIVVHAKVFDGLQRGVIVIESIWPNSAFEGGIGVNSLIGADPGAPNGGAVFHDSAVWVRRRA